VEEYLSSQAERFDEAPVFLEIDFLEIIQESAPLADEFQKPPAGMKILFMHLEMLRQVVDPFRQQGNLNVRGAGIALMPFKLIDDLALLTHMPLFSLFLM
jgi:hypothetical protein